MSASGIRRASLASLCAAVLLAPFSAATQERTAATQERCVANPHLSTPTPIAPRQGESVVPTMIGTSASTPSTDGTITFSGDVSATPAVTFRWDGRFRATDRFLIELTAEPVRTVSRDAPLTTTTSPTASTGALSPTTTSRLLPGTGAGTYTTAAGARQHTVTGLEFGRSYRWRVRVYNCGADSPFSSLTTFSIASSEPMLQIIR